MTMPDDEKSRFHIPIKHPEWLEHCKIEDSFRLWRDGKLPQSIGGWMLVTPIRHALRCIYGSDMEAAQELVRLASTKAALECRHEWKEVYYGHECGKCGTFYPFGCAPWDDAEDDEAHTDYD